MRTVYPVGTTLYEPDACWNSYTLLWPGGRPKLIDMNGRTVRKWKLPDERGTRGVSRAKLLPNGNLLVLKGSLMTDDGAVQEYDWDDNLVWEYVPEGQVPHTTLLGPHHDVFRKENGNTLLICRHRVPGEYVKELDDPRLEENLLYEDVVLEVGHDGAVVWEWYGYKHLELELNKQRVVASPDWPHGPYNNTACDWMHLNTVQALPPNRWHDDGDERFKPGNVMISSRSLDTVYLIEPESGEVVWSYSGDYCGGLSGQHEPHMIPPGLPGEGNVLVFDNGASPCEDLAHAARSFILEVNPVTTEVEWVYRNGLNFHAPFTSSTQRLPNGNTFICESAGRRVFEVTPEGETVWEYVEGSSRSYRYAYEHCPETAALSRPPEVPVTPPEDFRVEPDAPLEG